MANKASKLDRVNGVKITNKVKDEIIALLNSGTKVGAIKHLCDSSHWKIHLKESLEYCTNLQRTLKIL